MVLCVKSAVLSGLEFPTAKNIFASVNRPFYVQLKLSNVTQYKNLVLTHQALATPPHKQNRFLVEDFDTLEQAQVRRDVFTKLCERKCHVNTQFCVFKFRTSVTESCFSELKHPVCRLCENMAGAGVIWNKSSHKFCTERVWAVFFFYSNQFSRGLESHKSLRFLSDSVFEDCSS